MRRKLLEEGADDAAYSIGEVYDSPVMILPGLAAGPPC
jgi:hypothetical protein